MVTLQDNNATIWLHHRGTWRWAKKKLQSNGRKKLFWGNSLTLRDKLDSHDPNRILPTIWRVRLAIYTKTVKVHWWEVISWFIIILRISVISISKHDKNECNKISINLFYSSPLKNIFLTRYWGEKQLKVQTKAFHFCMLHYIYISFPFLNWTNIGLLG